MGEEEREENDAMIGNTNRKDILSIESNFILIGSPVTFAAKAT